MVLIGALGTVHCVLDVARLAFGPRMGAHSLHISLDIVSVLAYHRLPTTRVAGDR